jgi:hypothetical protein
MTSLLSRLPPHFATVPYDSGQVPVVGNRLDRGANCQRYAYAVLAAFGLNLQPWRSSELWDDATPTCRVQGDPEALDLLLFNGDADAYGAHVGVWTGQAVLHLCKAVGLPVEWPLERFAEIPRYRCLVGVKRVMPPGAVR